MNRFEKIALAAFMGALTQAACAADCLERTWQGSIGHAPVTLRFSQDYADGPLSGTLYYAHHLEDLLLVQDPKQAGRWQEMAPGGRLSGRLTLQCQGDALDGQWSSPDGQRQLTLHAMALTEGDYSTRRLAALDPKPSGKTPFGRFAYETLRVEGVPSVSGLRLIGPGAGLPAINRVLREALVSAVDEALQCRTAGRLRDGEDHHFEVNDESKIVAWNDTFVVIEELFESYCGGAHPYGDKKVATYALATGRPENILLWLDAPYHNGIDKNSDLGELLMARYGGGDPACAEAVSISGGVWPTPEGLVFNTSTSYAERACGDEILIPYREVAPFLSKLGKLRVRAFRPR